MQAKGLFAPYTSLLGSGLVQTLLTGGRGGQVVADLAASLMDSMTGCRAAAGTRKKGRVLVGAPKVVSVDGSISEYYLKIVQEMRKKERSGSAVSCSPALRISCWHQAASIMKEKAQGTLAAPKKALTREERLALENMAAMQVMEQSTKSFVAGRVRVRHPALEHMTGTGAIGRALAEKGIHCTWNTRAGSALLTYDARRMSKKQFMQAALPFARSLCLTAAR